MDSCVACYTVICKAVRFAHDWRIGIIKVKRAQSIIWRYRFNLLPEDIIWKLETDSLEIPTYNWECSLSISCWTWEWWRSHVDKVELFKHKNEWFCSFVRSPTNPPTCLSALDSFILKELIILPQKNVKQGLLTKRQIYYILFVDHRETFVAMKGWPLD